MTSGKDLEMWFAISNSPLGETESCQDEGQLSWQLAP